MDLSNLLLQEMGVALEEMDTGISITRTLEELLITGVLQTNMYK